MTEVKRFRDEKNVVSSPTVRQPRSEGLSRGRQRMDVRDGTCVHGGTRRNKVRLTQLEGENGGWNEVFLPVLHFSHVLCSGAWAMEAER